MSISSQEGEFMAHFCLAVDRRDLARPRSLRGCSMTGVHDEGAAEGTLIWACISGGGQ